MEIKNWIENLNFWVCIFEMLFLIFQKVRIGSSNINMFELKALNWMQKTELNQRTGSQKLSNLYTSEHLFTSFVCIFSILTVSEVELVMLSKGGRALFKLFRAFSSFFFIFLDFLDICCWYFTPNFFFRISFTA